MGHRFQSQTQMTHLKEGFLQADGETNSALRGKVMACAERLALGFEGKDYDIPDDLSDYVERVSLYAYRVTDSHVEALNELGYSEDMIFEITLSAALGAGLARFESGISAIKGEN